MITAYGYSEIYDRLSKMSGDDVKANALVLLKDIVKETKRVRYEGNGYAEEWHKEAEKRGLPNTKTTPEALAQFHAKDVKDLFTKFKVLSEHELDAKIEVKLETYVKIKDIEFKTAINIAKTLVMPSVAEHVKNIAKAPTGIILVTLPL